SVVVLFCQSLVVRLSSLLTVFSVSFSFFFSSRRRHTRWPRDWSSDVCSSDLRGAGGAARDECDWSRHGRRARAVLPALSRGVEEIGRASCRERVESAVGGGSVKRKSRRQRERGGGWGGGGEIWVHNENVAGVG